MSPLSKKGSKRKSDRTESDKPEAGPHNAIAEGHRAPGHHKSRTRRAPILLIGFIVLAMAMIFGRHPSRGPLLAELVSPAERFLDEIDRWGNFTATATIRTAIQDLFPTTLTAVADETPFYADILELFAEGVGVRRPLFFIPGYVTSGLELWQSLPCAKAKFRERIWGTTSMIKLFLTHTKCWVSHMLLLPTYGEESGGSRPVHFSDPEGIRIKPASGLAAADFLIGDYWVWNPIIETLGKAGYDESLMWMMSYDWRLALRDLEHKERYFSRMVLEIEKLVKLNGHKAVIVSHSFGGKVWYFFLQWVSHHISPAWVDEHVHTSLNIAPVFLGVPKAIGATLSGDTRDTAQMGALSTLLDTLLPQSDRSALTAGWGSIVDMLPLGGRQVWKSPMMYLNGDLENPLYVNEAMDLLYNTTAMEHHNVHRQGSKAALRCPSKTAAKRACYKDAWVDPLAAPLPAVRNSSVWCVYGTGIPTEVGYHYMHSGDASDNSAFQIDKSLHEGVSVVNGVILEDGDGTVPIQSLGGMCVTGWRNNLSLNPGNMTIRTREIAHGQDYSMLSRGGSIGGSSVDHVDIMGHRQVIRDILHLALGLDRFMDPPTENPLAARYNVTNPHQVPT